MAYTEIYESFASSLGISVEVAVFVIALISIWSLIWKGFALWKSAKKNSPIWFIALLIFNTAGILEILYIYVFSKMGGKGKLIKKVGKVRGEKLEEEKISKIKKKK